MAGMIFILIANTGIYMHTHVLADGTIVAHSHPYDKSENSGSSQSHHHTSIEFILLDNLYILFLSFIAAFIPGVFTGNPGYSFQLVSSLPSAICNTNQGRAPPIV